MTTFRTSTPLSYLPPTREEMKGVAAQVGLKKFSPDLVEDIANLVAGGELVAPSQYRRQVEEQARETLPAPTLHKEGAYWSTPGSGQGWTRNREEAVAHTVSQRTRYHQRVQDFLRQLDVGQMPGATPLEKAMGWLKLLAQKPGGESGGEGFDEEPLPIFSDEETDGEQVARQLAEAVETAKELSKEERELLDSEGADGQDSKEPKPGAPDPSQVRRLAEDMLQGKDVIVRLSRHLDQLVKMRVAKSQKLEADPEGDERRWRPIRHLGELHKIPQSEWALPKSYRLYRAITGQTPVWERCTRQERKQLLYLLVDCSGSMGNGQRIAKAGGVLLNRLKAVLSEDAEVYFRFFDGSVREEHHAAVPEEAKRLMHHVSQKANYSGGSTAIVGAVRAAHARIEEIMSEGGRHRPEIVVVTDGEDDVSGLKAEELGATRLHAFIVDAGNPDLVRLAQSTGGVGIQNL